MPERHIPNPPPEPHRDQSSNARGHGLEAGLGPQVSIVIPVFNEKENVGPLFEEIVAAMTPQGIRFEVLLVDDASTDGTDVELRRISETDSRVKVLRLSRNFGQSAAIQAGFDHARGQVLITLDGDLQNDPADIPGLLAKLESGYDLVAGWRKKRLDKAATRLLPSLVANWLIARLTGTSIHDNGCTLRAYRRELIEKTKIYAEMHRFLVPVLTLSGARYTEMVVHHRARQAGTSKYGLSRIWKVCLDLLSIKLLIRFVMHPAAWFAVLSFPLFVISILSGAISAIDLIQSPASSYFPIVSTTISLITVFAAANLLFFGFLAEVVVRYGDYNEADPILRRIERKG